MSLVDTSPRFRRARPSGIARSQVYTFSPGRYCPADLQSGSTRVHCMVRTDLESGGGGPCRIQWGLWVLVFPAWGPASRSGPAQHSVDTHPPTGCSGWPHQQACAFLGGPAVANVRCPREGPGGQPRAGCVPAAGAAPVRELGRGRHSEGSLAALPSPPPGPAPVVSSPFRLRHTDANY